MRRVSIAFISILVLSVIACRKDPVELQNQDPGDNLPVLVLPDSPFNYADLNLPDHVANNTQLNVYAFNNIPGYNLTTDEGAALGRVLFYDRRLSENNSISCSSCHLQEQAFSDNRQFSVGVHGHLTNRNSMSLLNMRYYRDYFWDMRVTGLEEQVLLPIQDPGEMNMDLSLLVDRLSAIPEYADLFETAFGDPTITVQGISYSLAQFIRSMVSFDAKYDQDYSNDFANFTELENAGRELFFSGDIKCNNCHNSHNFFTRLEPVSNGLETIYSDSGYYNTTNNPSDIGRFKIVSLRNIELTAPYMHDGRFETLEEVIDHYDTGINPHVNLDDRLAADGEIGGPPLQLNLTQYQKEALLAFLKTLTDYTVIADERFSDPFVY